MKASQGCREGKKEGVKWGSLEYNNLVNISFSPLLPSIDPLGGKSMNSTMKYQDTKHLREFHFSRRFFI